MEDFDAFARLVTALRPWLGQLAVVGGWAHRLQRFHRLANPPGHLPLRTRDTDLAFSTDAALAGDLRTALRDAGFTEERFGDDAPPATHYRLGEEDAAFYAEFLTPLHGSGVKRNGAPDATVSKAGVTAQKMRYLDLLLVSPWSVRVGPKLGVPVAADVDLLVPNPTSFMVQKLLIIRIVQPARRRRTFSTSTTPWSCSVPRWVSCTGVAGTGSPSDGREDGQESGDGRSGLVRRGHRHDSRGGADSTGPTAHA